MKHIIALSGGKDSTAMALRLSEVEPREYTYICTPTGDESPEMIGHWDRLETLLGKSIIRITRVVNGETVTLDTLIEKFNALPNNRQRWCTRMLKIEPTIEFIKSQQPAIQYVGFRADEEAREGIYSSEIKSDFPLRRWGWGISEVFSYLKSLGISIPERTDCLKCYDQRLYEWRNFLLTHPDRWAIAEDQEDKTSATFRSPSRDSYPAKLSELRAAFTKRRTLRGDVKRMQRNLMEQDDDADVTACRVCRF